MNKWKAAFWVSFILLVCTAGVLAYGILDQGVTITYMKDDYTKTESDLQSLVDILNAKTRHKDSLTRILTSPDLESDTLDLHRCRLFFKGGQLDSIKQTW